MRVGIIGIGAVGPIHINALKLLGRSGGIEFHKLRYVSLTHSSASSLLFKILRDM